MNHDTAYDEKGIVKRVSIATRHARVTVYENSDDNSTSIFVSPEYAKGLTIQPTSGGQLEITARDPRDVQPG